MDEAVRKSSYLFSVSQQSHRATPSPQVALLFLCDTINCAFDITFLYIPLVNNFGEYINLLHQSNAHVAPQ